MSCKVLGSDCLKISDIKPLGFDLTKYCANYFKRGEYYGVGETVRPLEVDDGGKGPNGFQYRVTVAGQTADKEPTWTAVLAAEVISGSVTFVCEAISNSSLASVITDSEWEAPTGTVASGDATQTTNGEQKTAVFLEALQKLSSGLLINKVTFEDTGGNTFVENFALKIKVT